MPDPSRLRDSTQIVLPCESLDGLEAALQDQFTVTVVRESEFCRIIASPVEIKEVSEFLVRHGVSMP